METRAAVPAQAEARQGESGALLGGPAPASALRFAVALLLLLLARRRCCWCRLLLVLPPLLMRVWCCSGTAAAAGRLEPTVTLRRRSRLLEAVPAGESRQRLSKVPEGSEGGGGAKAVVWS